MNTGARGSDRRVAVLAAVCVALSIVGVAMHALHVVPAPAAAGIVLAAVAVGLRIGLLWAIRAASSPQRARVLNVVSLVGLAVSTVTLIAVLPHVTRAAGLGRFTADLMAHAWTLGLLTAAAAPVRTLPWRAFVGAGLMGFLAVSSISRLVGRPVVSKLGDNSVLAVAGWAPFSEEVLKALPVVVVVLIAVRRTAVRPSALDLVLLGAWSGTGFALYENALFGRGGADWGAAPPFSLLVPSEISGQVDGVSMVVGGHLVYSALIGLGVAVGVLYRRRWRWAWLAAPVAAAVAYGEHAAVNAVSLAAATGHVAAMARVASIVSLGGWLSSLLLAGGLGLVASFEYRQATRAPVSLAWLRLPAAEGARRTQMLAGLQCPARPVLPVAVPVPVGGGWS